MVSLASLELEADPNKSRMLKLPKDQPSFHRVSEPMGEGAEDGSWEPVPRSWDPSAAGRRPASHIRSHHLGIWHPTDVLW